MTLSVTSQKVQDHFSNAAVQYDQLTDLHKNIGARLIGGIVTGKKVSSILDVGMGTGWFTDRLTNVFPGSKVIGLDFAHGMVSRAQKRQGSFEIVQADAVYLPFRKNSFDIITSNLAYQWVDDLSEAFDACYSCLHKKGKLYLTLFGHDTFHELFLSLDICLNKKRDHNNFRIKRLINAQQVGEVIKKAGFNTCLVGSEHLRIYFSSMMDLVKWIKDIGANTLPKDMYLGKELFVEANKYYNNCFRDTLGVYATFEVIWIEAER